MKHIDDWLDEPTTDPTLTLVKEWLEHFRRPAIEKDHQWLNARVITCVYDGKHMRCIGASRLGDVWLTYDLSRINGYDKRISVEDCTEWQVQVCSA